MREQDSEDWKNVEKRDGRTSCGARCPSFVTDAILKNDNCIDGKSEIRVIKEVSLNDHALSPRTLQVPALVWGDGACYRGQYSIDEDLLSVVVHTVLYNHCGNEFIFRCKSAWKYIVITP
jgi:hypothetical protein